MHCGCECLNALDTLPLSWVGVGKQYRYSLVPKEGGTTPWGAMGLFGGMIRDKGVVAIEMRPLGCSLVYDFDQAGKWPSRFLPLQITTEVLIRPVYHILRKCHHHEYFHLLVFFQVFL